MALGEIQTTGIHSWHCTLLRPEKRKRYENTIAMSAFAFLQAAPGLTRNKKLLGTKGIATRRKDAAFLVRRTSGN